MADGKRQTGQCLLTLGGSTSSAVCHLPSYFFNESRLKCKKTLSGSFLGCEPLRQRIQRGLY